MKKTTRFELYISVGFAVIGLIVSLCLMYYEYRTYRFTWLQALCLLSLTMLIYKLVRGRNRGIDVDE